jgi:hypothetical protein
MISIFSIPKPFLGRIETIQYNAIATWKTIHPKLEIILIGDDQGVRQAAKKYGCKHIKEISKNKYQTPIISDAFKKARATAKNEILMYSNCDMIYDQSLITTVQSVPKDLKYLICGRRYDCASSVKLYEKKAVDICQAVKKLKTKSELHGFSGIDYFIYAKKNSLKMPKFYVGRCCWDNWLIWAARKHEFIVIDATLNLNALHQNHDYQSQPLGDQRFKGPELESNIQSCGSLSNMLTLREAHLQMIHNKLYQPKGLLWFHSKIADNPVYQKTLGLKRSIYFQIQKWRK